jgi:hypothetical protein
MLDSILILISRPYKVETPFNGAHVTQYDSVN